MALTTTPGTGLAGHLISYWPDFYLISPPSPIHRGLVYSQVGPMSPASSRLNSATGLATVLATGLATG